MDQLENNASIIRISNVLNLTRQEFSMIEKHLFLMTLWTLRPEQGFKVNIDNPLEAVNIVIPVKEMKETNVARIREALDKITSRKIHFDESDRKKNSDNFGYVVPFISARYVSEDRSYANIHLKLNPECKKLFLELANGYTKTDIQAILSLKSTSAIRMYELMSMHLKSGQWTVDVSTLKGLLGLEADAYKSYFLFKKKVLEYAQKQLWDHCNVFIDWEVAKKEGKKVIALTFEIVPRATQEGRDINDEAIQSTDWVYSLTPDQIRDKFQKVAQAYSFSEPQKDYILANKSVFKEFVRLDIVIEEKILRGNPVRNRSAYMAKSLGLDTVKLKKIQRKGKEAGSLFN